MDRGFITSLEVTGPDGATEAVPLTTDSAVVGRSADSDVRLADPRVSRRHARLDRGDDGVWRVTDLGSENGTRVDGIFVEPNQAVMIAAGRTVDVGPFALRLLSKADDVPATTGARADHGADAQRQAPVVGRVKIDPDAGRDSATKVGGVPVTVAGGVRPTAADDRAGRTPTGSTLWPDGRRVARRAVGRRRRQRRSRRGRAPPDVRRRTDRGNGRTGRCRGA